MKLEKEHNILWKCQQNGDITRISRHIIAKHLHTFQNANAINYLMKHKNKNFEIVYLQLFV